MKRTIACLILLFWAGPALAQTALPCAPDDGSVERNLAKKYKEHAIGQGVTTGGRIAKLYRTEDGKTWTILVFTPRGLVCADLSGTDWEEVVPKPGEKI